MSTDRLTDAILRATPSGEELDRLVGQIRPAPGIVIGPLGEQLETDLLREAGLYGKKLVGSTTKNRSTLDSLLRGPNRTVLRSIAMNPFVTPSDITYLAERAISGDGALAMALVRNRPSLPSETKLAKGVYDMLSTRTGQPGSAAVADVLRRSTDDEFKELLAVDSTNLGTLIVEALPRVWAYILEGRDTVNYGTIREVYSAYKPYTYGPKLPRGLRQEIQADPNAAMHALLRARASHPGPQLADDVSPHTCSQDTMNAVAGALGLPLVSAVWQEWKRPLDRFFALHLDEQVRLTCSNPDIAIEILSHFPDIGAVVARAGAGEGLPSSVFEHLAGRGDMVVPLREMLERGCFSSRGDLGAFALKLLPDDSAETNLEYLSLMLQTDATRGRAMEMLSGLVDERIIELAMQASQAQVRKSCQSLLLGHAALDPYASTAIRNYVFDVSLGAYSTETWATASLEKFAAEVALNPGSIDTVIALHSEWEGTAGDLLDFAKNVENGR